MKRSTFQRVDIEFGSNLEKIGGALSDAVVKVLHEASNEWDRISSTAKGHSQDMKKISQGLMIPENILRSTKSSEPKYLGDLTLTEVDEIILPLRQELPSRWMNLRAHVLQRLTELETTARSPAIHQAIIETFTSPEALKAFPLTGARRRVADEQALEANLLMVDNRKGALATFDILKTLEHRAVEPLSRVCDIFKSLWKKERFVRLKDEMTQELDVLLESFHPEFIHFSYQQRLDAMVSMQKKHLEVLSSFVLTQVDERDFADWLNQFQLLDDAIKKCIGELSCHLQRHNEGLTQLEHDMRKRWSPLFAELSLNSSDVVNDFFEQSANLIRLREVPPNILSELPDNLGQMLARNRHFAEMLFSFSSRMAESARNLLTSHTVFDLSKSLMHDELERLHDTYLQRLAKLDENLFVIQKEMDFATDEMVLHAAAAKAKSILNKIAAEHSRFHTEVETAIKSLILSLEEETRRRRQKFCDLFDIRMVDRPGSGKAGREEVIFQASDNIKYVIKNPKEEVSYLQLTFGLQNVDPLGTNVESIRPQSPPRKVTSAQSSKEPAAVSALAQIVSYPPMDVHAMSVGVRVRWIQNCLTSSHKFEEIMKIRARELMESKNFAVSNEKNAVLFALELRESSLNEQLKERVVDVLESVNEIETEYESRIARTQELHHELNSLQRKMNSKIDDFRRVCRTLIDHDLVLSVSSSDCETLRGRLEQEFEMTLKSVKELARNMQERQSKIIDLRRLIRKPLNQPRNIPESITIYEQTVERLKTVMVATVRTLDESKDDGQFAEGVKTNMKMLKARLRNEAAKGNLMVATLTELCGRWKSIVATTTDRTEKTVILRSTENIRRILWATLRYLEQNDNAPELEKLMVVEKCEPLSFDDALSIDMFNNAITYVKSVDSHCVEARRNLSNLFEVLIASRRKIQLPPTERSLDLLENAKSEIENVRQIALGKRTAWRANYATQQSETQQVLRSSFLTSIGANIHSRFLIAEKSARLLATKLLNSSFKQLSCAQAILKENVAESEEEALSTHRLTIGHINSGVAMCERVGQILDRIAELEATTIRELAQVESEWKQLIIAFPPGKQETAPLGERFRSCDRSDLTHSNDQIRSALEDARRRATETLSRIL